MKSAFYVPGIWPVTYKNSHWNISVLKKTHHLDGFLKTKYDSSVDKPLHSVSNYFSKEHKIINVEVKVDNGNENTGAFFVRELNLYEKETEPLKLLKQTCLRLFQLRYDCL